MTDVEEISVNKPTDAPQADLPPNRCTAPLTWGPWRLDTSTLELVHEEGYRVDLEDCTDSAETLDWIAQIAGKGWGTPACVGYLVVALDDLLNMQATLCSLGQSLTLPNPGECVRRWLEKRAPSRGS